MSKQYVVNNSYLFNYLIQLFKTLATFECLFSSYNWELNYILSSIFDITYLLIAKNISVLKFEDR